MSQSWFSLGFLSQNSLWKLSTFRGYKGIYSRVREECEKSFFCKTGHSGDSVLRVGWVASKLPGQTINFCPVVLQLSWPFRFLHALHVWHFGELPIASHSRDPVMRNLLNAHTLEFFTFFSHTTLTLFPPKYRVSNCWNTSKFGTE